MLYVVVITFPMTQVVSTLIVEREDLTPRKHIIADRSRE